MSDAEEEVILTFSCQQSIEMILIEASKQKKRFSVIMADSSPDYAGKDMVERLISFGIKCTYTLIQGLVYLISKVTKVFLGVSSVLSNGAVVGRIGTSMVACIAFQHHLPVVMFSETYKFTDKVNLDPINNNEIGNPQHIATNSLKDNSLNKGVLKDWESRENLTLLNLKYDLTKPNLISMIVCELGQIPAISVPIVIRESNKDLEDNEDEDEDYN
mmetsp:Transcript_11920/g.11821  ORF Transcript_11920/g.11821 Transcript_11920/m.11821 type:complete len:216 (-) Transcript_11920:16-663(-)